MSRISVVLCRRLGNSEAHVTDLSEEYMTRGSGAASSAAPHDGSIYARAGRQRSFGG